MPIKNILAQVQPAITTGYAIVGALLGDTCDIYRATTADDPISSGNKIDTQDVLFDNNPGFKLTKSRDYKTAQQFASLDRTNLRNGDYLVDRVGGLIRFLNGIEPISPTACELCNGSLSFYRPTAIEADANSYVGNGYMNQLLNEYGGNVSNLGDSLALNWPASMLSGTKGELGLLKIPNESRSPWFMAKIPLIPGVILQTNDLAVDSNGVRYLLSLVEISELGFNLTLDQVMA